MKKLALTFGFLSALGLTALLASPSDTGLENGKRLGWDKQSCPPHAVPDAGSTLGMLALSAAALGAWKVKTFIAR